MSEETTEEKVNRLIDRIEFHEGTQYRREQIETRFYVTDLVEFIRFCSGDHFDERIWNYELQRSEKSRAFRPNFQWRVLRECFIYPKENMVAVRFVGLHYICQHSFDLLPRKIRSAFFSQVEPFFIGNLHTKKGEKLEVFTSDIGAGFSLHRDKEKSYKSSFVRWIKHRNQERKETKEE